MSSDKHEVCNNIHKLQILKLKIRKRKKKQTDFTKEKIPSYSVHQKIN